MNKVYEIMNMSSVTGLLNNKEIIPANDLLSFMDAFQKEFDDYCKKENDGKKKVEELPCQKEKIKPFRDKDYENKKLDAQRLENEQAWRRFVDEQNRQRRLRDAKLINRKLMELERIAGK